MRSIECVRACVLCARVFSISLTHALAVFAVGELSGLLKEGAKLAQKALKFHKLHTDVVKSGDARLFRVSVAFDVAKAPLVGEVWPAVCGVCVCEDCGLCSWFVCT